MRLDFELNTLTYLAPMVHDTDVPVVPRELESILPGFPRSDPLVSAASRVAPADTSAPLATSNGAYEHVCTTDGPYLTTQQLLASYPSAPASDPWKFADETAAYSLAAQRVKQEPLPIGQPTVARVRPQGLLNADSVQDSRWPAAAQSDLFAERALMPPPPPPPRVDEASRMQLYRQRSAEPQAAQAVAGGVMHPSGVRIEIRPRGDSFSQTTATPHKRTACEAFERTPSSESLQPQQKARQRPDEALYLDAGFMALQSQLSSCAPPPPSAAAMRPMMTPRLY